jgi:uncharacterized protein YcfL
VTRLEAFRQKLVALMTEFRLSEPIAVSSDTFTFQSDIKISDSNVSSSAPPLSTSHPPPSASACSVDSSGESSAFDDNQVRGLLYWMDHCGVSLSKVADLMRFLPQLGFTMNTVREQRQELNNEAEQRSGLINENGVCSVNMNKLLAYMIKRFEIAPGEEAEIVLHGDGRTAGLQVSSVMLSVSMGNRPKSIVMLLEVILQGTLCKKLQMAAWARQHLLGRAQSGGLAEKKHCAATTNLILA